MGEELFAARVEMYERARRRVLRQCKAYEHGLFIYLLVRIADHRHHFFLFLFLSHTLAPPDRPAD